MKKERCDRGLAAACRAVRVRQESAQKTRRQMLLILSLVWALILGRVSASSAATTCGIPDSCIITLFLYHPFSYPFSPGNKSYSFLNVDTNCTIISQVQKDGPPAIGPATAYEGRVYKFFYTSAGWANLGITPVLHIHSLDALPLISSVTYSASFTSFSSMNWANPYNYIPANCSLLPPATLSNTPNPAPGRPDCPQVPLN